MLRKAVLTKAEKPLDEGYPEVALFQYNNICIITSVQLIHIYIITYNSYIILIVKQYLYNYIGTALLPGQSLRLKVALV